MIAIAHYSASGDVSGVTTWLGHLVRDLRARGIAVAVQLHHLGPRPTESELRSQLLAAGATVESEVRARYTEARVRSTLGFLERHQPAVFLPQCLESHFYAAAIAGDRGLPWVFTLHSDDPLYWAALEQTRPGDHRGVVVPVSHHVAALAEERGHLCRNRVIPCGVLVPGTTTAWNANRFRIVYSGRVIEEQKRISLVIETMVQACVLNPCIEGRVVGRGEDLPAVREVVRARGLESRITFTGRLEPEAVGAELEQAQAILLMSDYEGLPVALLEAMARGVVPVARAIPSGIPELVHNRKTGLLVDGSPRHAAQALALLAQDRHLWKSCSDEAQRLVTSDYNATTCHRRWADLISTQALPQRATLRFPGTLVLPPVHPELRQNDVRDPGLLIRNVQKLQRAARRAKRSLLGPAEGAQPS